MSSWRIQNPDEGGTSYGQILRVCSIIGGATGINYVISSIRLLHPARKCAKSSHASHV